MKRQLVCVMIALGVAGCSCCGEHKLFHRDSPPPIPPPPGPVAGSAYYLPAHPLSRCNTSPVPRYAAAPPGMVMNPPMRLPPTTPPQRLPDDSGVRLAIPERSPAESARQGIRLFPPQNPEDVQPAGVRERAEGTPSLPVGIPQFAMAKERIASGLKPTLEGVDWLNATGYVAVLYLRAPGSDDSAERKRIENTRGLKYFTIEVSPETLSTDVVEHFNKLVGDSANLPLFVYDNDGILAGGLWYLHFRLVDKLPDDKAIREAGRLGLQEKGSGENLAMWLAVQKYLKDQNN
jgi:hypothetical protein